MAKIFVSYASGDKGRVQPLIKALTQHGWSVWWDRTIPIGRTFDEVIGEALDAAQCVVVVWSNEGIKSQWVRTEAEEAARRRILVPVLIDDVLMPLQFRRIQAARLIDWDGVAPHPELDRLVDAVRGLFEAEARGRAEEEARRKAEDDARQRAVIIKATDLVVHSKARERFLDLQAQQLLAERLVGLAPERPVADRFEQHAEEATVAAGALDVGVPVLRVVERLEVLPLPRVHDIAEPLAIFEQNRVPDLPALERLELARRRQAPRGRARVCGIASGGLPELLRAG